MGRLLRYIVFVFGMEEYTCNDMDTTPKVEVMDVKIGVSVSEYNECSYPLCDHLGCHYSCPYGLKAKL